MKQKRIIKDSDTKIVQMRNKCVKRKKTRRIVLGTVLLAVVLILTIMLTPFFNLKLVEVSGNSKVTHDTVFKASGVEYDVNIFRINTGKMKKKIENIPYIKNVKVKRRIPNKIKIIVTERIPVVAIKTGQAFTLMDINGRYLENVKKTNLPVMEGVNTKIEVGRNINEQHPALLENFARLYLLLEKDGISKRITSYKVGKNESVSFIVDGSKRIVLGSADNVEYKFKMLEAVINELPPGEKGTINLSEEGKALYSPE